MTKFKRLTGWDKECAFMCKCFENKGCKDMGTPKCELCEHNLACFNRLAEYEDTGLTPGEISKINDFANSQLKKTLAELQKYKHQEEHGLIVHCPCKLGDAVWGIRNFKGVKRPRQGIVSDMHFDKDMRLVIVVKHVCRGKFGKRIFLTRADAETALNG